MKYECPHCGEKSISHIKKAFAGNPKSKGAKCPICERRCTNELKSAVCHSIFLGAALIFLIVMYLTQRTAESSLYCIIAFAAALIIPHIIDAFFFKLVPAIRLD